jgi:hypothetical protein
MNLHSNIMQFHKGFKLIMVKFFLRTLDSRINIGVRLLIFEKKIVRKKNEK